VLYQDVFVRHAALLLLDQHLVKEIFRVLHIEARFVLGDPLFKIDITLGSHFA
jgi:hypothetical protein